MKHGVYHCPVEVATEVLSGRWTPVVLAHLKEGDRRYAELGRLVPDVSEKMLTQTLRSLESEGLVNRTTVSTAPPHVVYALSDLGRTLEPALEALYRWGQMWAERCELEIRPTID